MSQQKRWVKKRYGELAAQERSCCGKPTAALAERIGYRPEEAAAVPEGANLSLGCGNPLALADLAPGETVLDLGSGAGFDAFLAAARVGPQGRVIGVDMTPEMIRKARANAAKSGYANVEFREGDIEDLPVDDASVDLVISNCVLNLTPDKAKAFREIARVLKPGGRIAISDIVLEKPLPEKLRGDADAYCSCVSGAIERKEYLRKLRAAGLTAVRVVAAADAAELLTGDCGVTAADLAGVVSSVHIVGRRPRRSTARARQAA